MIIDRIRHSVYEVKDDKLMNSISKMNEGKILGIVGVMNIIGHNYLCVIKNAENLGSFLGAHLYKIT